MPKKRSSTPAKKATKAAAPKTAKGPGRKARWGDRDDDGRGPADAVTLSTSFVDPEED